MNGLETDLTRQKINQETAKLPWKDLQRFFAGGLAFVVGNDLDLIEVACQFTLDNKEQAEQWIQEKKLCRVSDQQAIEWFESDAQVWAVVVKPWVLVQSIGTVS